MEVHTGKNTHKQEKRRVGIHVAGNNLGSMAVWGGVAVLAVSFVVASVSAFKSRRKKKDETSRAADELNKRISTDEGAHSLEVIAKMGEDKVYHESEAPNKVKEKNGKEAKHDGVTQKYQLSKVLVNTKESEAEDNPVVMVPKKTYAESVKGQGHQFGELVEGNEAEEKPIVPVSKKTYAESVRGQGHQFGEIVEESVAEENPIVTVPKKTYAESVRAQGHAEIVEESEADEKTNATVPKKTYAESVRGQGHQFGEVVEESRAEEKPIVTVPKKTYAESVMGQGHQFGEVVAKKDTKESEAEKKRIVTAPKITYAESVRGQNHQFGEVVVRKDEELAEETEMDTPTILGEENEEDGDENNGISKDGADIAEVTYLQQMEKQQECNADEIIPIVERLIETAPRSNQFAILDLSEENEEELVHEEEEQENDHKFMVETSPPLNQFSNEGKLEVKEEESVHEDEEQKHEEGKVMVEIEEESSETNEDDDEEGEEEESEENSEGTADSSIESNVDAIWPAEAMDDMLMDIKQRKIDNQILEETTEGCIEVARKQKSLKNDNSYATERGGNSSESLFNFRKRYVKELLLDPSKTRTLIWALLVIVLALAAPLVLVPGGMMKL